MSINERFEDIIQALFGGNKRAFALGVGISPTVVENVVGTRQGKPSFDVLVKVCANANVSAEYLLMGNGSMLAGEKTDTVAVQQSTDNSAFLVEKIAEQAEEIGRLKAENELLKRDGYNLYPGFAEKKNA